MKHIITHLTENYPIQPEHIKTTTRFWDAFGHSETESSAHWLVRFAKSRGGWKPFNAFDIDTYYKSKASVDTSFSFNRLWDAYTDDPSHNYIQLCGTRWFFTHEFISKCFVSSPELDPSVEIVKYVEKNP